MGEVEPEALPYSCICKYKARTRSCASPFRSGSTRPRLVPSRRRCWRAKSVLTCGASGAPTRGEARRGGDDGRYRDPTRRSLRSL